MWQENREKNKLIERIYGINSPYFIYYGFITTVLVVLLVLGMIIHLIPGIPWKFVFSLFTYLGLGGCLVLFFAAIGLFSRIVIAVLDKFSSDIEKKIRPADKSFIGYCRVIKEIIRIPTKTVISSVFKETCQRAIENIQHGSVDFEDLTKWNNRWKEDFMVIEYIMKLYPEKVTADILAVKNENDWTVAHYLAGRGKLPEEFMTAEILSIADGAGWTVAHELAQRSYLPQDLMTQEILSLKDKYGNTVKDLLR